MCKRQDTNVQAQIILLWAHDVKIQLSREGSNAEKDGRKGKKRTISSKVDGLSYSGERCTVGRPKGRN